MTISPTGPAAARPAGQAAPHPSRRLAAAVAGWHRALLNAQATGHPAAANPYALLQAVLHDPDFAWLRQASDLMVRIDEANAKGATPSAEAMQGFLATATALLEEGGDAGFQAHLQGFAGRPEVATAQAEALATLRALRQAAAQ